MESANTRAIEASVSADLARTKVDLDRSDTGNTPPLEAICALIRRACLQRLGAAPWCWNARNW